MRIDTIAREVYNEFTLGDNTALVRVLAISLPVVIFGGATIYWCMSRLDRLFPPLTAAFAQPGAIHAGFEYFRMFERDAQEFAELGRTRLRMPMLVLTGEKASGEFLIVQGRLVADKVDGVVVKGSGHWLMDEAPDQVIPKLVSFLTR
jgi:pimeloyl-ACP methyl ester carboxylesterase